MALNLPLLVEWSPGSVRTVDPVTLATAHGATIAECRPERGREVVVAVGRRSAFIRSMPVPSASRSELERIVATRLMGMLPLEPNDLVFGFRLSADGRHASVGAMRAEALIRLYAEAQAAGLRVRAVLPAAYGSWLTARDRALAKGAVLSLEDGLLNVDVVDGGELVYSRVVPTATPVEDADDETLRTFATVGMPPAPVLALAAPELPADAHDAQEALLRLADLRAIQTRLFSLELPARRAARLARAQRMRVARALVAAGLALGISGYAYVARLKATQAKTAPRGLVASVNQARRNRNEAEAKAAAADQANRVLDVAFRPAQTATDVVAALAQGLPPDAWVAAVSVARGAPASVAGYALRNGDVGRYFEALSKDPRFRHMQVVSANAATIGKTPVVQFLVSGEAVGVAPFDRPLRRGRNVVKAQPKDR